MELINYKLVSFYPRIYSHRETEMGTDELQQY